MADVERITFDIPDHIYRATTLNQDATTAIHSIYSNNPNLQQISTRQLESLTLDEFCYRFEWLTMLEGLPLDQQVEVIEKFVFRIPIVNSSVTQLMATLSNNFEVGLFINDIYLDDNFCDVADLILGELLLEPAYRNIINHNVADSLALGIKSLYDLGKEIRMAKSSNTDVATLISKYKQTIRYFQLPFHFDMLEF